MSTAIATHRASGFQRANMLEWLRNRDLNPRDRKDLRQWFKYGDWVEAYVDEAARRAAEIGSHAK